MNDQELLELKSWGHQLFTLEFQRRKITKNKLYQIIQAKIKRNPHFAQMKTEEEVREVINLLLRWIKKNSQSNKKPSPISKKTLAKREKYAIKEANKRADYNKIREAIRRLPKIKVPWYKKLFTKLFPL